MFVAYCVGGCCLLFICVCFELFVGVGCCWGFGFSADFLAFCALLFGFAGQCLLTLNACVLMLWLVRVGGCLVLLCVFIVWLAVLGFAWWRAVCWLFVLLWYVVLVF